MNRQTLSLVLCGGMCLSLACSSGEPRPAVVPPPNARVGSSPTPISKDTASIERGPPADTVAAAVPDESSGAYLRKTDSIEVVAIRAAEGKAFRVEGRLHVQLSGGRTAVYEPHGYRDMWHHYAGYLKAIRSHVIHVSGTEGSGIHILVDDSTGDTTATVANPPVLSPDGTRFVVSPMDAPTGPDADYDPLEIEVWRVMPRKAEREFSVDPEGYVPSNAVWRDSVTIDFIKTTFVPPDYTTVVSTPASLRRIDGKWVMPTP